MTREEAIETLKLLKPNMRFDDSGWLYTQQAFEMAIQALEQKPETVTEFADRCRECGARYGRLLNQKWIPVSERLPENSGNFLITYCSRDEIETQEAVYVEDEDKWYDITDIEITLAVVAWMPLSEPYKVEPQERSDKE